MTEDEIRKLLYMINGIYPNFKANNPEQMIEIWTEFLGDQDSNAIAASLKMYVRSDTSGFAPSIGQLIQGAYKLTVKEELTPGEAWSMVHRAICRSTYYATEEFNKLPKTVQRAVGSADQLRAWATDEYFNEGVASSNFRRAYQNACDQKRNEALIPADVAKMIESLTAPKLTAWEGDK